MSEIMIDPAHATEIGRRLAEQGQQLAGAVRDLNMAVSDLSGGARQRAGHILDGAPWEGHRVTRELAELGCLLVAVAEAFERKDAAEAERLLRKAPLGGRVPAVLEPARGVETAEVAFITEEIYAAYGMTVRSGTQRWTVEELEWVRGVLEDYARFVNNGGDEGAKEALLRNVSVRVIERHNYDPAIAAMPPFPGYDTANALWSGEILEDGIVIRVFGRVPAGSSSDDSVSFKVIVADELTHGLENNNPDLVEQFVEFSGWEGSTPPDDATWYARSFQGNPREDLAAAVSLTLYDASIRPDRRVSPRYAEWVNETLPGLLQ